MMMYLQPNAWSCLPTAFGMLLDCPPVKIFDFLKHDGSQIVWPDLPEPECRRGFHIQEMYDFCRYSATPCMPHHFSPALKKGDHNYHLINRESINRKLIACFNLVVEGVTHDDKLHAIAWSAKDQRVFDPRGSKTPHIDTVFKQVRTAYYV